VLVAAIAAGVLINTAGFLQSQSEQTGQQSSSQVSDRLQVINTIGEDINEADKSIGTINMTVKKAPGAEDISLDTVTAQYISDDKIVNLVYNESAVVDPNASAAPRDDVFQLDTIQDDDDSIANSTVLNEPEDRAKIVVDINGSLGYGADNRNASAIDPLNESASASVQLTTQAGGETTVTITVPDSLTNKDAVDL
jgi:flagellin FlaB